MNKYDLKIDDAEFASLIPGITSGMYDIASGTIMITEERAESVNFSDVYYTADAVAVVRKEENANSQTQKKNVVAADFNSKRLGIKTGSSFEAVTLEKFPDAEYYYYDSTSDLIAALENNKIDAFVEDEPVASMAHNENSDVDYLHEPLLKEDYCFGFSKKNNTEKVLTEFNEYLAEIKADGSYDSLLDKWFYGDEAQKTVDNYKLTDKNGTLKVVVLPDNVPFAYNSNNELCGFAVEMTLGFAEKYGYDIEFEQANATAALAGMSSRIYDIFAGSLSVTEERKETINFSDPFYNGGMVLVARSADIGVENEKPYLSFNGRCIGIRTGASTEPMTFELFPDSEYSYLDSTSDLTAALQNKKIDAFLEDEPVAAILHSEQPDVDYIREPIIDDDYHFGFQKDTQRSEKLQSEFNSLIAELKADGTLEQMREKWINGNDDDKTFDNSKLTGENGSITVAVVPDSVPFAYTADNELKGYAVELATIFARKYGYSIDFEQANLTSCLSGLSTGKYDMFAWCLSYTDERAQSIDYSDVVYNGGIVLVARSEDISDTTASSQQKITSPQQLNDKKYTVGVVNGTYGMFTAEELLPNAEILMFDDQVIGYESVRQGKTDAFVYDRSQMETAIENGLKGVELLPENLGEPSEIAVGISRKTDIPDLQKKLNDFLAEIKADGTLDDAYKRWVLDRDYTMPDIPVPDSPEMKIVVGTTGLVEPFSFYANNELAGFDIELIKRFALYLNADVDIRTYDFVGIVSAAESGDIDCIFTNLNKTPERMEVIDFSDPVYIAYNAVMVASSDTSAAAAENESWLDSIKTSFEKNFIRESRYKLILKGIGTTCIITVLTIIFGSVLAFLICLFRRTDSVLAGRIADIYVKLLQGTPMVVLLMILYYVIFGKSGVPAIWVAVIGFSMNFAAYVSETLQSGIDSIDGGQREAALALGYSENQAFFRFIFPQAAVRQLPVYRGEIISLLKNTSIVGYIAIQDLTKMSDIIRSRTYEAFFPLIATAVIYFILAWLISLILKFVMKRLDPRSKKRAVKGGTE